MGIWKDGTKYCDECGEIGCALHAVRKNNEEIAVCGKCLRNLIEYGWMLIIGK